MSDIMDDLTDAQSPTAFVTIKEDMLSHPQYKCLVIKAYETQYPNHLSFAFPKESPYTGFFNFQVLRILETGVLNIVNQRHSDGDQECDDKREAALSFVKVISLFAILAIGCTCSIILLSAESIFDLQKQKLKLTTYGKSALDLLHRNPAALETKIKKFMFKWGISNRDDFTKELYDLMHSIQQSTGTEKIVLVRARSIDTPDKLANPFRRQFTYTDISTNAEDKF